MLPRVLIAAACVVAPAAATAAPNVVASIVPVHALVAGVMEGVGEPTLLVGGNASPHDYALRPSEARAVANADLLFWVGPKLETFLAKPVAALGEGRAVELLEAPGVETLPTREGGVWEAHEEHGQEEEHGHDDHGHADEHEEEHHDDHAEGRGEHAHGEVDAHVWLDPHNAAAIVAAIADRLAEADPANAAAYRANAERLTGDIAALDAELAAKLAPVKDRPFIVFHDAYQYFEAHYGLHGAGAITVDPERRPGAQRIQEIRDRVRELEAVCVFAEPQFEPALVQTIAEDTGARTGVLDPEGAGSAGGRDAYFQLMRKLADDLVACLAG